MPSDSNLTTYSHISLGIVLNHTQTHLLLGSVSDAALQNGFGAVGGFSFPGGGVDETDADPQDVTAKNLAAQNAAVREVLEETGLRVSLVQYLGFRSREDVRKIVHYNICLPLPSQEISLEDVIVAPPGEKDIAFLRWVAISSLLEYVPRERLFVPLLQYLNL